MQADRRLVEDIEHTDQTRADLRGEPNALRFTTRQRARRAGQRQVVQADVEQEAQPGLHLLEDLPGDGRLTSAECEVVEELRTIGDGQLGHFGNRLRAVLPPAARVTARISGLSRVPLHSGHGTSRMNPS